VTEETRLTSPTSRRCPRPGVRPLFEGSAVLFRGCGTRFIREWVAQCHGADAAQCHTVAGMASPGGQVEKRRGMIPRRVRGVARIRL
jgi:hypothetical protein